MLKVLSYIKPYRRSALVALFLMLAELFVELLHPLLMAKIINDGVMNRDHSVIFVWGAVMVLLALIGFASGIVNSFFAAHVSQGFGFDVRQKLFGTVQSFNYATYGRFQTSSLITRITNDVTQVQNMIFMGLRIMMRAPLFLLGGLVMALWVDFSLALILALIMPVLVLFLFQMLKKGLGRFRTVQERLDHTNGVLRENLMGMRLIKSFVRGAHEIHRFSKSNEQLRDKTVSALRLMELTIPVVMLLMNVSVLFIVWLGHEHIMASRIEVGDVVAVVNYATRMAGSLTALSMIFTTLSRARASAERISEVLDAEQQPMPASGTGTEAENTNISTGEVVFERVSFTYPETTVPVLQSVSFQAKAGTMVAVLGATGSGKSSMFQLIPRLYEPASGRILIDGCDIRSLEEEELRRCIGYVPQQAVLFSGTIRENILWGKEDASPEEIVWAAKNAQIHDTIMKLPQQYETVLGQKGVNLSGGQKQRLTIARALIRKPKLLLLDDSTSALDLKTEAALLQAIHRLSCTTMIITQKISTARSADHVLLLEEGRLIAQGRHEQLLSASPLYQAISRSQSGEEAVTHVRTAD
ncbi:ABC transporter ATP-binding protein [Marinicrinis lubricantis]|uniref:ABC transporter ATP-binding protein n=1 Tax=Marinicrinis lubricantis TaxID=2086470 RepID=A0ABW1IVH1_9BACL